MGKRVCIVTGAVLLLLLFFTGCQGKTKEPEMTRGDIFIYRLANPDEAFNSLIKDTDPATWSKYHDKRTAIIIDDREKICYTIGVRSANALLAVFLNDFDLAGQISEAIKDAARKLNIKSEDIETVAKKLVEDLKEKDEKIKRAKVKQTLNALKDQVVKALNNIGNKSESLMIEYGAWVEAVRETASIVADNYSAENASALARKGEAEYFKSNFGALNVEKPTPAYKEYLDMTDQLLKLMTPGSDKTISKDTVNAIKDQAILINGKGLSHE